MFLISLITPTHCWQPRPGHSHMVCSHPCHWTDPNAVAVKAESRCLWVISTKAERKVSRVSMDPYPTLITVVSFDEAFAEATSCVWITRVSSWQHSQRITGTSCQNTKRSNRINCISLSDCSYCMFIYTEYVCVYFHLKFCGNTMIFYYYCRTKSLRFFYPKIPQMYLLTCWN